MFSWRNKKNNSFFTLKLYIMWNTVMFFPFRYVNIFLKLLKVVNMVGSGSVRMAGVNVCIDTLCLQVRLYLY